MFVQVICCRMCSPPSQMDPHSMRQKKDLLSPLLKLLTPRVPPSVIHRLFQSSAAPSLRGGGAIVGSCTGQHRSFWRLGSYSRGIKKGAAHVLICISGGAVPVLTAALAAAHLSQSCSLCVPLDTPRKAPRLVYDANKPFHASALMAAAIDTCTLPYRIHPSAASAASSPAGSKWQECPLMAPGAWHSCALASHLLLPTMQR